MIEAGRIAHNVASVRARIHDAAERAGRDPSSVGLVAVTKTVTPAHVRAIFALGVADIGENRSSELREKQQALVSVVGIRWHFVGHLQTNKVRDVVGRVALVHSVDSERLLSAMDSRAGRLGVVQDVLLEVNLSGEATKHGLDAQGAEGLCRAAGDYSNVQVRGLMTMAPLVEPEGTRPVFSRARRLFDHLSERGYPRTRFDTLSMGMSNDFEVAVEEGATLIRIGTALFV